MASNPTEYHESQGSQRQESPPRSWAIATFMLKQILTKHGLDGNKDPIYLDTGRETNCRLYSPGPWMPPCYVELAMLGSTRE